MMASGALELIDAPQPPSPGDEPLVWHATGAAEAMAALSTSATGLTKAEAEARLRNHGPNVLPHEPPPAWWLILLRQFRNPLIYILAAAALVSLAVGDVKDALFIGLVLGLNAAIGGYQEWRAEQSSRALQQLLKVRAQVLRDGEMRELDAEEMVPGDVAWLESGNRVPADMRLLWAHHLEVDESLLTGESLAVSKSSDWSGSPDTGLADRRNMVHAGSVVARGRARGVVVATGTATAVGQLALQVLQASGGDPPLIRRVERFSHAVGIAVLVAAIVVAVIGVTLRGYSVQEMFFFAVALAISAIPEGLPAALTVALAIAATRMARRRVIVRRLAAVEGLGSCTLIASDKTGTLTCNELMIREVRLRDGRKLEVTGEGFIPTGQVLLEGTQVEPAADRLLQSLARAAVLCNEADLHRRDGQWVWHGDAVDIAFLTLAHKLGRERERELIGAPQLNEIPFEPERQFAASYHAVEGRPMVFVKGAPERVLHMCEMDPGEVDSCLAVAEDLASRGFRVLAVAEGPASDAAGSAEVPPEPRGLALLALVGMIDPLRSGAAEAVEACHDAGIVVWMVTGDHPVTALAISRELGLATNPEQVVTGKQLEARSPAQLQQTIQTARVFARVAPHQKLQLVEAAQKAGHLVAVTGDGVNDAPALRAANIGVAMGKSGTDVAREAAELVISDDNFTSIVAGVEEGRVAYKNVRNVVFLLLSTGAAEVLLATWALVAGLPLPLLPIQLLWLNLVTNGIQGVALAFEPKHGDELKRPPRPPQEPIFNRLMIERTVLAALVMGGVAFAAFDWMLRAGWSETAARNSLLLLMVLFENVHIGNCRSETRSALRLSPLRSPFLLAGATAALLVHVAAMHFPVMQELLGVEPVGLEEWLVLFALALTVFVVVELHKLLHSRRTAE